MTGGMRSCGALEVQISISLPKCKIHSVFTLMVVVYKDGKQEHCTPLNSLQLRAIGTASGDGRHSFPIKKGKQYNLLFRLKLRLS